MTMMERMGCTDRTGGRIDEMGRKRSVCNEGGGGKGEECLGFLTLIHFEASHG
jgi:hypothetical protein